MLLSLLPLLSFSFPLLFPLFFSFSFFVLLFLFPPPLWSDPASPAPARPATGAPKSGAPKRGAPRRGQPRPASTGPGQIRPAQARSDPVQPSYPEKFPVSARTRASLRAATSFRRRFRRVSTSTCSRCRYLRTRAFGSRFRGL